MGKTERVGVTVFCNLITEVACRNVAFCSLEARCWVQSVLQGTGFHAGRWGLLVTGPGGEPGAGREGFLTLMSLPLMGHASWCHDWDSKVK